MLFLSDALKAIEGRKDFLAKRYDGLVAINYVLQLPDSFEGIRRELRGITFDEISGEIISLPLHKFLNINQSPETQWDLLKDQEGVVYEKMDGSLIHFFFWKGELRAATRMSCETIQAKKALALAEKLGITDIIISEIKNGYTPIFELVAPNNQVVVRYPRSRLVYLNSRNRKTGEYCLNPQYQDRAQKFNFSFREIFSHLDKEEFEGYVCHLENGLWVKCKCSWYLDRHRVVDAFMKPVYTLYGVVYQGVMDDLIAYAPEQFKAKLRAIYTEAQLDFLKEQERILTLSKEIKKVANNRKEYVYYSSDEYPKDFSLLMSAFDDRDLTLEIQERLLEGYKIKYPERIFQEESDEGF